MERVRRRSPIRPDVAEAWSIRLSAPLPAIMAMGFILVVVSMLFSPFLFQPSSDERRVEERVRVISTMGSVQVPFPISPLNH